MDDEDWEWLFVVSIGYVEMMDFFIYDSRYLITLIEGRDVSTNTLILPTHECTIKIKDVYKIF